jgi:8-oxo-dGTP pyrophosphatase MutT (NUDIX family)
LITTLGSGKWSIPKGLIDTGETPEETALKEALEEAGLHGRIVGNPIARFTYHKWNRDLSVVVYLMEVTCVEEEWLESDLRERHWAAPGEAIQLVGSGRMQKILEAAFRLAPDRLSRGS